ncbi:metal-dependent hydrolase family protein [Mycolicibacterium lutetiense]|uniref:Imidazolonepropionase-like amidohydrolase n=1 Tax=Mycolicibacterium lutetiense TaxID=1641992 RepID=A0ABS4ZVX3_9MYCO|nr:amidohydrolase family protein [Mycolicibacterium lutetiense]MBP2453644.1 imidazolonepropionase-like amidohydrolase [Mycolicibacterium lutetiense]
MRGFGLLAVLAVVLASAACSTGGGETSPAGSAEPGRPAETGPPAPAPPAANVATIDFSNVKIFDGHSDRLSAPSNVRVKGNRIERISTDALPADPAATVIDGGGRTLMPGLIDNHWHTMLVRPPVTQLTTLDPGYLNLLAGAEANDTLMRGFTTVRDLGGPSFGLKKAIDEGVVNGPRIFPSGAIITVTSGHGDFRTPADLPRNPGGPPSRQEELGAAMVADSPDEVRMRAREQLFQGASQIKLTAGGGVSSPHSPLDVTTFTEPELRAATEAAGNWGTYVAVHAYTPQTIQQAIRAGVTCIEHAHLMDEATAKEMADKNIWLSTQPIPAEMIGAFPPGSDEAAKAKEIVEGVNNVYQLARKYKLKTAFGTDILFSPQLAARQGALLAGLGKWFSPAETLAMATGTNGELLALSGKRSPYAGKLGVVAEGALADLLLVDGDPLARLDLIADPERNFKVIMKDGKTYKNTLVS